VYIDPKIYVILGIIATAAAQIFLKIGSSQEPLKLKCLFYLFLSLFLYAISFLSYYMALRYFDISKISPIMMAIIVSLVALYGFTVGENFNHMKFIGIILAIISVFLISRS
jgi:drug/metabolite transporter (DMT)-like permease